MPEFCERCRREAPASDSDEYVYWEAVERADGQVGVICPGCLTGKEEQEIDEDAIEMLDEAARRQEWGDA